MVRPLVETDYIILTEVRVLDTHPNDPLEDLIRRLLEERVIRSHLQIALRKLRFGMTTPS